MKTPRRRLEDGEVIVTRIEDPRGLNKVAAKGTGKSGGTSGSTTTPHQPVDYPNTLRSRATVRILEVLSEGVVYGLVGTPIWQGVFLDGTPIVDEAGNTQFQILQGDFRYGYPSQDPIPGYPISEASYGVGVEAVFGQQIIRALNVPVSAVRYILQMPALYIQEADGDVIGTVVIYAFDIRVNGGAWQNVVTEQIYGKTMSTYQRAVRIELPWTPNLGDSIEIRILNLQDPQPSSTADTLIWSSYVEIIDGALSYDDTAVVSMTVDAQQFPNVPQRAYLLDGIMLQIPTNYDGRTHGLRWPVWDGTFYEQWTNNPAWVLYNILTNERWGLGKFLDAAAVDKWSFYDAQQWCDAPVSDGRGGIETRWTCNCVINTRQDAYTVIAAIASSMCGQVYFAGGTVFLALDRLITTPTRIFGPADVVGGLFDYAGADYRSRWTAIPVIWVNPQDDYNSAVELVIDPQLVAEQGYKESPSMNAFGCTSQAQAQRFGRWSIYTNQFETEVVTFQVGLENADLRPGDYIMISDPQRAGARLAGRTLEDDGANTVTLDSVADEMRTGIFYGLYVTVGSAATPDDPARMLSLTIINVPPTGNQITVAGKTSPIPPGSMWLAHSGQVEPTPWRVASIADRGQAIYEITATEYHQEKFAYVDEGVYIPPPSFSLIPTGPLLPPSDLKHREYIYLDGTGWPQFGVVVSWAASPDSRVQRYQVEMSGPGSDYRRFNQIAGFSIDVPLMRQGQWMVVLVGFDNIGRRTQPLVYNFIPRGLLDLPSPPDALFVSPNGPVTTLTWVPTGEIDVVYFWLKWSPRTDGTATWARAVTSVAQVNRNTTQVQVPTRSGTFMIKTIDALGQESADWEEAILVDQVTELVKHLHVIEQPDWLGNLNAIWHYAVGELWLPPPAAPETVPPGVFPGDRPELALNPTATRVGVYDFEAGIDLGIVCSNVSMVGIIEAYGVYRGVVIAQWVPSMSVAVPLAWGVRGAMSNWIPLAIAIPLAMDASKEWDGHIEMAVSQDGVAYADWTPLRSTIITGRAFKWRMVGTIYDLKTTMRVVRCEVQLEIPLRNIQGVDVPLEPTTGHLSVTYPVPFLETPTVQLTGRQSLPPNADILLTVSDAFHFEAQQRPAPVSPATTNASIDYFVQGFGGHAA